MSVDLYRLGVNAVVAASGILVKEAARRETKILRELLGGVGPQKSTRAQQVVTRGSKDTRWSPEINPFPERTAVPYVKGPAQTPPKPAKDFVHRYKVQAGSDPTKADALLGQMQQRGYAPREYVGHLGGGGEGSADLVARRGRLETRKTYNPDAQLYSPEGIRRKEEIMQASQRRLGKDENPLTEFYESKTVRNPTTGKDYTQHYTEYVPHTETGQRFMDYTDLKKALGKSHPDYRASDFADTWQSSSHGNNIAVTPSGRQRVVDFIPAKASDGVLSGSDPYGRRGIQIMPDSTYFPNHHSRVEQGLPLSQFADVQKNPDVMQAYMHRGALPDAKSTPWKRTVPAIEYDTAANADYYKSAPSVSVPQSRMSTSGPAPAYNTPAPRNYDRSGALTRIEDTATPRNYEHSGPVTRVERPASRQRAT